MQDHKTQAVGGKRAHNKVALVFAVGAEPPRADNCELLAHSPVAPTSGKKQLATIPKFGQSPAGLGLVAVKGELGEARVGTDDLLQASLRLRPDRIVLGELRGTEAVSFLRAINTGHPGSFSTIHANNPGGALEQLGLMVMQAGLGLTRADTLAYAQSVIDIIVQLDKRGGERTISGVHDLRLHPLS